MSAVGILDYTFGDELKKVEAILRKRRPKYLRVHLLNTTCVRGNNCGKYEPVAGHSILSLDLALREGRAPKILKHVRERAALYRTLSEAYPDTSFLVSPALEHNLSIQSWRNLADAVKKAWPKVQLVNNPMVPNGDRYRGAWLENHGNEADLNSDIVSLDGNAATDIDIVKYRQRFPKVKILYTWDRPYNLRLSGGPWVDPRERKAGPTRDMFELLVNIITPRGAPPKPKFPCKFVPFKPPYILKPFAEEKGFGDPRANKPVSITDSRANILSVVTKDGQSVGGLGFYGTFFENGLYRHYSVDPKGSGLSGYQFEKALRAKSGSPWGWLRDSQVCRGPVILGRRAGVYR